MKYSLRSLMVVVTLICIFLGFVGGRVQYRLGRAAYHKSESKRLFAELEARGYGITVLDAYDALGHDLWAEAYTRAAYRPWASVEEIDDTFNLVPP